MFTAKGIQLLLLGAILCCICSYACRANAAIASHAVAPNIQIGHVFYVGDFDTDLDDAHASALPVDSAVLQNGALSVTSGIIVFTIPADKGSRVKVDDRAYGSEDVARVLFFDQGRMMALLTGGSFLARKDYEVMAVFFCKEGFPKAGIAALFIPSQDDPWLK